MSISGPFSLHFNALQAAFPVVTIVSADRLSVESLLNGYYLSLTIVADHSFPRSPPRFFLPFNRVEIPTVLSPCDSPHAVPWDPAVPDLVVATKGAFQLSLLYWGRLAPPTVPMLANQLSAENPAVLQAMLRDPGQLDAYVYRHSMCSAVRSASQDTVKEVQQLVKERNQVQDVLEKKETAVLALQEQLKARVLELESVKQDPLFRSMATPEAFRQSLTQDVSNADAECRLAARGVLQLPQASDKQTLENALDDFRSKAKRSHLVQLMLMEYEKGYPSPSS